MDLFPENLASWFNLRSLEHTGTGSKTLLVYFWGKHTSTGFRREVHHRKLKCTKDWTRVKKQTTQTSAN